MTEPNVKNLSLNTIAGISRETNRIKRYIQGKADQSRYHMKDHIITDVQLNYSRTNTALTSLEAYVRGLRKQFDALHCTSWVMGEGWYAPDGEPYLVNCKRCYIVHAIGEGRDGCIDGGEPKDRWFTNS